ncbi:MAG TPA: GNAT family N-acetyltransferase [Gammaproteobacteria bacterium]|nr:GNAT family N-acetyltransferase [Gammaproteobacteria bacterium]
MSDQIEWVKEGYRITCNRAEADVALITGFLSSSSYWAKDISLDIVQRSIDNSLNFILLKGNRQVGFARVVTDYATVAYLSDVFILPAYRGNGLGKWLIECVVSHPRLQGFRRWLLATLDAHKLYEPYGFSALSHPEWFMEKFNPGVYSSTSK